MLVDEVLSVDFDGPFHKGGYGDRNAKAGERLSCGGARFDL